MANLDTGLGWSIDERYLTNAAIKLGDMTSLAPVTAYMEGGVLPTGNGIPAEVYARGKMVYINNANHNQLYALAAVGTSVVAVNVTTDPPTTSNPADVYFISDTKGAVVYTVTYHPTTGTVGNVSSYTLATSGGGYYRSRVSDSTSAGYDTTMIPHYTALADAYADLTKATQPVYKYAAGPAGGAWVRWIDLGGIYVTAPTLISTVPANTQLSLDGQSPASTETSVGIAYKGKMFTLTLIPGHTGGIGSASVPFLDLTAAFPRPISLSTVFEAICIAENIQVEMSDDPYGDFGNSEPGQGDPNPDPQDDDIEDEGLPTLSFASAGFARIYRPNLQQINDLADYMWTDQTFLQTVINHLKQLIENPMDAVISLSLVPCVPPVGADIPVKVMYVNTGVSMPPVTSQFVTVDCGTVAVEEMYGSALDYNPYTKVQLYLPYIGTVQLNTDEVMSMTMQVKYNIDVVTGVCCAYVRVYGTRKSDNKYHDEILYQFSGHCSVNQPISSADFSSYLNAAIAAAKISVALTTGAAGVAAAAGASGVSAPSAESTALTVQEPAGALVPQDAPRYMLPPSAPGIQLPNINWGEFDKPGTVNTVAAALGGKVEVAHSGGFGGNSGYLAAVKSPYLIIVRPRIANPQQYGQFNGRPSMMYLSLGSCTGYTQVQSVYLTGFNATNPELAEISELLKAGVVL